MNRLQLLACICSNLDLFRLSALIMGSFFPCIYYGFYCDPTYQVIYLTGLTVMGAGQSPYAQLVFLDLHKILPFAN